MRTETRTETTGPRVLAARVAMMETYCQALQGAGPGGLPSVDVVALGLRHGHGPGLMRALTRILQAEGLAYFESLAPGQPVRWIGPGCD